MKQEIHCIDERELLLYILEQCPSSNNITNVDYLCKELKMIIIRRRNPKMEYSLYEFDLLINLFNCNESGLSCLLNFITEDYSVLPMFSSIRFGRYDDTPIIPYTLDFKKFNYDYGLFNNFPSSDIDKNYDIFGNIGKNIYSIDNSFPHLKYRFCPIDDDETDLFKQGMYFLHYKQNIMTTDILIFETAEQERFLADLPTTNKVVHRVVKDSSGNKTLESDILIISPFRWYPNMILTVVFPSEVTQTIISQMKGQSDQNQIISI